MERLILLIFAGDISLHDLNMEGCGLGVAGADKIGELLYHNSSITILRLGNNNIEDDGLERLAYYLSKNGNKP